MEKVELDSVEATTSETPFEDILVELSQKDLKSRALKAREQGTVQAEVPAQAEYSNEVVYSYVEDLSNNLIKFAEQGALSMRYLCQNLELPLIRKIASEFKKQSTGIMVILDTGAKEIKCDWSGNNEC